MDKILLALAELKNFLTAKADNETKVAAAQAELAIAQGQLAAANALVASRDTAVATLTADLATANAALVTSVASVTSLTAANALESKRTDETLAALGVNPATIPAAPAPAASTKTMTRSDFEALPHADRNAFIRNGGKLK